MNTHNSTVRVFEDNMPDRTLLGNSMFKPCCMTLFLHDYAFPPSDRQIIFPFIYMEGKPKPPTTLQIYSVTTLELVRTLSDEELGKLVRQTLAKLDENKNKIENPCL